MREKLIELLINSPGLEVLFGTEEEFAKNADWLIANGVTIATDNNVGHKWIPVTERLPGENEYGWVLVVVELHSRYGIYHSIPIVAELRHGEWYDSYDETIESEFEKVTHWMPIPEPPKGE